MSFNSNSNSQSNFKSHVDILCSSAREIRTKAPSHRHQALLDLIGNVQEFWTSSDCCKSIKTRLDQSTPDAGWNFNRCVLLGLGHVAGSAACDGEPLRPVLQFVVFLDCVKLVGGPTTELFAQDPRFTAADKAVLKAYGVRVLDLPKAEQIIDEQTFVMSPGLIIPDLFFAQTTALPGLLVGHGGEQTRRDPETHVQEVLKRMEETEVSHELYEVRAAYVKWTKERYELLLKNLNTYSEFQVCEGVEDLFSSRNYWRYVDEINAKSDSLWNPGLELLRVSIKESAQPERGEGPLVARTPAKGFGLGYDYWNPDTWHAQMDGVVPYQE